MMNALLDWLFQAYDDESFFEHSRTLTEEQQQQGEINNASASSMRQSLPLCIGFAAVSGLLRVVATMVLAYPDFLDKKQQQRQQAAFDNDASIIIDMSQHNQHQSRYYHYVAAHLTILLVAAIMSIIATLYGPVSIAVPVQTGSSLLWNVVAMGIVLQMRAFNKAQRTGTYVVFFSILELVDVGPGVQEGQDALQLLSEPMAMLWTLAVTCMIILAAIGTIQIVLYPPSTSNSGNLDVSNTEDGWFQRNATLTLAMGVTMSNVGMATSSKTFASLEGVGFLAAIVYYLFTTFLGVFFSVVSSTACDQGIFTPLSSVALIITNMLTGIIIWEDWKVLDTWLAYVCACFLMVCGVYLLAEIDLIEHYGRKTMARVLKIESRGSILMPSLSSTSPMIYVSPETSSGEFYGSVISMNENESGNHHADTSRDENLERLRSSFSLNEDGIVHARHRSSTGRTESPSTAAWQSTFLL